MKEVLKHYNNSKKNYEGLALEGGEMHIAYYRDKHPHNYEKLEEYYGRDNK